MEKASERRESQELKKIQKYEENKKKKVVRGDGKKMQKKFHLDKQEHMEDHNQQKAKGALEFLWNYNTVEATLLCCAVLILLFGLGLGLTSPLSVHDSVSVAHHACRFCGATFASKNKLFKHLRDSDDCAAAAVAEDPGAASELSRRAERVSTAVLLGYRRDAAVSEALVSEALQAVSVSGVTSTTRASSWRHRASPALAQAATTAATGDVVVFSHAGGGRGVTAAALPRQRTKRRRSP